MTKIPKGTERRNLVHSLRGVSPQLLGSMHLGSMWRRKLFTLCWTRSRERGGEETQTERKRQWQRMKRLEQTASYSSELTLTLTLLASLWPWPSSLPCDPDPPLLPRTLTLLTSLWPWASLPPCDPDHPLHDCCICSLDCAPSWLCFCFRLPTYHLKEQLSLSILPWPSILVPVYPLLVFMAMLVTCSHLSLACKFHESREPCLTHNIPLTTRCSVKLITCYN